MLASNNRAFKEWAVVCDAMKAGEQIVLIRKGGISEEGGIFRVNDPEFFLMPTYEHQNAELLQDAYVDRLAAIKKAVHNPDEVRIDAYAVVDTVVVADNEDRVNALAKEYIWNATYVKQRFDFNPYDPLYVMLLRVYNLPKVVTLAMIRDYEGCKSWVSLERALSTNGAVAAVSGDTFARRRAEVLDLIGK